MDSSTLVWTALLMALAAGLCSTIGNGGGSGYRAIMALFPMPWMAAIFLFRRPARLARCERSPPSLATALRAGAGLGLLAALTGTRGGILFGREDARRTCGIAADSLFSNTVAGPAGNPGAIHTLPAELPRLVAAVAAGALVGTWLGFVPLPEPGLLQPLGSVFVAGTRPIVT